MDSAILDLIKTLGVPIAVLLFILWLFLKGKLHSDDEFVDVKKERDFWRNKSLSLLDTAQSAVDSAVKLAPEDTIAQMAQVVDEARQRGEIP